MKKLFKILIISALLLLPTHQAHADSETAKKVIGGIIGFGLQQIEQEMQNKDIEPTAPKNDNPTQSPVRKNTIIDANYRDALQLVEGKDYANYFIATKFKDNVKRGLEISSESIPDEALKSLKILDIRGLKLMSSYEEALKFAKSEQSVCQSLLSNFHSISSVLNFGNFRTGKIVSRDNTKVSQNTMFCKKGAVSYLSFTPLGRLDNVTINFLSEENNTEILKTFKNKLTGKTVENKCKRRANNKCEAGRYYFEDKYANITLRYEDKKTFKDGKYLYSYEMELSSKHLTQLDYNAMKQTLQSNEPKKKTKL